MPWSCFLMCQPMMESPRVSPTPTQDLWVLVTVQVGVVKTAHPASRAGGVLKVLPGQRGRSGLGVCRVEVSCQKVSPCLHFHKGSRWFGKIQFKRTEIKLALQGSDGQDSKWGQLHYLLRAHQASMKAWGGWVDTLGHLGLDRLREGKGPSEVMAGTLLSSGFFSFSFLSALLCNLHKSNGRHIPQPEPSLFVFKMLEWKRILGPSRTVGGET